MASKPEAAAQQPAAAELQPVAATKPLAAGKQQPPEVPLDTKLPVGQLMGAVEDIRRHHEQDVAKHKAAEAAALADGGAGGGEGSGDAAGATAEANADGKPAGYPGTALRLLLLLPCLHLQLPLSGLHAVRWSAPDLLRLLLGPSGDACRSASCCCPCSCCCRHILFNIHCFPPASAAAGTFYLEEPLTGEAAHTLIRMWQPPPGGPPPYNPYGPGAPYPPAQPPQQGQYSGQYPGQPQAPQAQYPGYPPVGGGGAAAGGYPQVHSGSAAGGAAPSAPPLQPVPLQQPGMPADPAAARYGAVPRPMPSAGGSKKKAFICGINYL